MNDKGLRSLIYKKLIQINKNDNYLLNVFCALKFYVCDLVQTSLKKKKTGDWLQIRKLRIKDIN